MKITFILISFLFISSFAQTQNFKISKADSLRSLGQLDLALEEFAKEYEKDSTNRNSTYNYACALALNRNKDKAFYYLEKATIYDTTVQILNDADFYFLIDDPRWSLLEEKLAKRVEAKYGAYKNLALAKELWRMKIKDQAFYYHLEIAEKQAGRKSPINGALWELKSKINAENLKRIVEIIDTYGWPKSSDVGDNAAGTVFLIIQHSDIEIQKKYLPVMTEAANAGEASWSSLALLIDRVNLKEGKKQVYGSQIYRNEDGSYYVKDLEEPEYVNQRRNKVGLGPIEEYVSRWNVKFDVPQKEK